MKEYYYFSTRDKELANGDGRKIQLGVTHKVECTPILCKRGLHASAKVLDALQYAHSPILWKVTLGGKVIHGEDKSVATERTYLKGGIDISDTLQAFARKCALDVVHLWDAPQVVIDYLKTGDEGLRALAQTSIIASTQPSTWASTRTLVRVSALSSHRIATMASARETAKSSTSASPSVLARASARALTESSISEQAAARISAKNSALAQVSGCGLAWASTSVSGEILDYINKSQNRRLAQMISKALKESKGE